MSSSVKRRVLREEEGGEVAEVEGSADELREVEEEGPEKVPPEELLPLLAYAILVVCEVVEVQWMPGGMLEKGIVEASERDATRLQGLRASKCSESGVERVQVIIETVII